MTDRQTNFERAIVEWDERALTKCVDFAQHRFISIERDALTDNRYVKGHKSLRGACWHMARTVASGEAYVPEKVLDLDTGELHEVDLFVHVAPMSVDAVSVMLPREAADFTLSAINHVDRDSVEIGRLWKTASVAFERALERRR